MNTVSNAKYYDNPLLLWKNPDKSSCENCKELMNSCSESCKLKNEVQNWLNHLCDQVKKNLEQVLEKENIISNDIQEILWKIENWSVSVDNLGEHFQNISYVISKSFEDIKKSQKNSVACVSDLKEQVNNLKFDSLTKLGNRHKLQEDLQYIYKSDDNYMIALLDLDDFKTINDNYGYIVWDQALQLFSTKLREIFGENSCYRLWWEEFIIFSIENWYELHENLLRLQEYFRRRKLTIRWKANLNPIKLFFSWAIKKLNKEKSFDDNVFCMDKKIKYIKKDQKDKIERIWIS